MQQLVRRVLPAHSCAYNTTYSRSPLSSSSPLTFPHTVPLFPMSKSSPPKDQDFYRQGVSFPSRRSVVHSINGIIACTQPLAAEAGHRILRQGGNAAVRPYQLYLRRSKRLTVLNRMLQLQSVRFHTPLAFSVADDISQLPLSISPSLPRPE